MSSDSNIFDDAVNDLSGILLGEEVGKDHVINGVSCKAMVSGTLSKALSRAGMELTSIDGSSVNVSATELGFVPVRGQLLTIDGKENLVVESIIQVGDLLTILINNYTG